MFQCPEPGLYMFTLTVCTYDGKKCLLILRKNEKDVCALIDQVPCNALPKYLMKKRVLVTELGIYIIFVGACVRKPLDGVPAF